MNLAPTLQDCWNQIGVWGDTTCPRLAEIGHCRNCPVYVSSAGRLLHGEPPEDYVQEWTERLAQPRVTTEAETASALIFRLGREWFALRAAVLQEVAEPRPIHSVPHRRGGVLAGLVNIRGELLVCVSLSEVLGLARGNAALAPNGAANPDGRRVYERLLVVSTDGGRLAFPVCEIHGVEPYAPENLRPVPVTLALSGTRYTRHLLPWGERSVGFLDDAPLFHHLNRSLG